MRETASFLSLELHFQIPPKAWMSDCFECCVLLGRGLSVWSLIRKSPTEYNMSE